MSGLWTEHIRLPAQTCPGIGFPGYIRGPLPLRTLASLITSSSNLLRCPSALKAILGLLHRIPSVSRGFDSPTLRDLQTLVGFLSPKVFSRFLQDFFVLRRSIPLLESIHLEVLLGSYTRTLNLVLHQISISCKLKIRFSYLNVSIYLLILQCKSISLSIMFLGC
jgi:hypothetical protein